jgi:hypothetical protein
MRFPRFNNLFSNEDGEPRWWLWLTFPFGLLLGLLLIPLTALNPQSWKFNREEARAILKDWLKQYEGMSIDEIRANLPDDTCRCGSVRGPSGEEYQLKWKRSGMKIKSASSVESTTVG